MNTLPPGPFGCILADPPWQFASWSDKGRDRCPDAMVRQKGLAERHYATMTMAEIKAMPVADVAARDCALFLWAVNCQLPDALDVMRAWGFTFKTVALVWTKEKAKGEGWALGMGYWTRQNAEICLLGTRGKPKALSHAVRQLIVAPRREHSRKPDETHERIERLVAGPRLEMFARQSRPGWVTWGAQANRFDEPMREAA